MSDLYKIPGDTGKPWRLKTLIDFILAAPDEITPVFTDFLDKVQATQDERVWWAFLYSTCYSITSTIVMFNRLDFKTLTEEGVDDFWKEYKSKLIFQSDRRYIKQVNQFPIIVKEFLKNSNREPYKYISQWFQASPEETYKKLYSEVGKWKYYGRYAITLFIRSLVRALPEVKIRSTGYDWKHGATTTSALFTILYEDEKAQNFEAKTYKLSSEDIKTLDGTLQVILKVLESHNPDRIWDMIDISYELCAYRKLFKASRYPGYYVDRQQEEIITMENNFPEYNNDWKFLWKIRKNRLDNIYLGEINGWSGIRKQLSPRFLKTGLTTPVKE